MALETDSPGSNPALELLHLELNLSEPVFHIYLTGIVSISRCDLCNAFNMGTGTEESLCKWTLASSSLKLPHKPGHKLRNGGRCQNAKNSPLTNTASSKAPAFLPGKAPSDMGVYTDLAYYAWGICIF